MWKVQVVHATWTEQVHGPNGRRAPQVTPRPANLQCQNTLGTLTSWENRGRCRLTLKFPIKHENKTICLTWGSRLTPKGATAFSPLQPPRCVSGWRTDPWGQRVGGWGGSWNEVCPGWLWLPHIGKPHLYLIPSSRVCNHEVNQHDTMTSITPAPVGVTCLLLHEYT